MVEMKRRTKEVVQRNEQEMQFLRRENEEMKKKLMEGGPSTGLTNVVGRSFTSPPNLRPTEDTRDKIPTHEMDGESFLNKSARTTITMDSARRHPFTNTIIEVPLLDKWKGFNRDRYGCLHHPYEPLHLGQCSVVSNVSYIAEGSIP